jgi:hypothetical protein
VFITVFINLEINMKYLTYSKIFLPFAFIILILLQGCNDSPGTWVNKQISSGKRDDFHKLNTEALQYIKADDMNDLSILMSKELAAENYTNHTVDLISNELKANDYTLMDEYYIVRDSTKADTVNARSPTGGKTAYNLQYSNATGAKYIALFIPKSGLSKSLISLIYNKYDYGWKISSLNVAPYTINGKTAPELFELAKQQFANNHLVSAVNTAQLATLCLKPAEIWQYNQQDDINTFYGNLTYQVNNKYSFPFVLTQVATHPKIISIINQSNDGGSYPEIYYVSSIKVADTDAIKKENLEVRKAISTAMPGLDKDNKYLLYSVTNKVPSATENTPRFDMIERLQ